MSDKTCPHHRDRTTCRDCHVADLELAISGYQAENEWLLACQQAADGLLAIMLANIDHAMGTTHETPAVFKVTPDELGSWAHAVEAYETARFPEVHEASDD